jgi:hypothetical protein
VDWPIAIDAAATANAAPTLVLLVRMSVTSPEATRLLRL